MNQGPVERPPSGGVDENTSSVLVVSKQNGRGISSALN